MEGYVVERFASLSQYQSGILGVFVKILLNHAHRHDSFSEEPHL